MPSEDPLDCLVEIASIAIDRMNKGSNVGGEEAFTLGEITGICCRLDAVMDALRQREAEDLAAESRQREREK
jgi:hypothetical protein